MTGDTLPPDIEMVTLQVTILAVRQSSVLLGAGERAVLTRWIPRSLIHPEDAARLDSAMIGQKARVRIARRKADEVGFDTGAVAGAALREMFPDSE